MKQRYGLKHTQPNPQRSSRTNCMKGLCVPECVYVLLMSIIKCPTDHGVLWGTACRHTESKHSTQQLSQTKIV